MSNRLGVHVTVVGRVQGVYYRDFTRRHASVLNIIGWVRNLPDGTVEVLAEGEEKKLLEFLAALQKGPPGSQVENMKTQWQ
jgi:acylphosphatase